MTYQCEIKERAAQPALVIRARVAAQDLPQRLGQGYASVYRYLFEQGVEPAGPPFVAYYNMDMQDLDVAMGYPVARVLPGRDELQASELPAGRTATCLHTGPYSTLGTAYDALQEFIREGGHQPSGVVYEHYVNDPAQTPPEELETQIEFLLR